MWQMTAFLWAHGRMLALGVTLVLGCGVLALAVLGWLMPAARSVVVRQRACEAGVLAALVWLVVASVPLPRVGWGVEGPGEIVTARGPRSAALRDDVEIPPELIARPRGVEEKGRGAKLEMHGPVVVAPAAELEGARIGWRWWVADLFVVGAVLCTVWLLLGRVVLWWTIRRSRVAPVEGMGVLERVMGGFSCADDAGESDESGAAGRSRSSRSSAPAWFGRTRLPRVRVTRALSRPMTCGVWRPVILLPESLLEAERRGQLRQVLLHELGHIRQGDGWGNALFCAALPVLYWHPLYWWLRRCSSLLRELVADDWASRADGKEAYVTELVALARTRMAGLAGAGGAIGVLRNRSDFYRRMRMLLERQNPLAMGCSGRFRAGLAVGALAVVVGLGATVGVTPVRGQTAGEPPAEASAKKGAPPAAAERVIRRNDLLSFSIQELAGPVRQVRVSDKGTVIMPLIGTMKVEGLTPADAEQAIRQKYRDANLIQSSKISIEIVAGKEATAPQAQGVAGEASGAAAPAPGDGAASAKMTDAQIGILDDSMRKLLDERAALEARMKELGEKGYAAQHPEMVRVAAQLADAKAKVEKYAQDWRDWALRRAQAGEPGVRGQGTAGGGGDALAPARGERAAVGGVQLDVVSLANSTVEAAGAVRVAKVQLAAVRKLKETGAFVEIEREEANLETAVKRLELLKGIAGIALDGARQESDRAKQLYQQGALGQREVSDAESRVKMLELILKSAG